VIYVDLAANWRHRDTWRRTKISPSRATCGVHWKLGPSIWFLPSQFYKTTGEGLPFLLAMYFWDLSNHKIRRVKFGKQREMLILKSLSNFTSRILCFANF
jgi:hypothetical protein